MEKHFVIEYVIPESDEEEKKLTPMYFGNKMTKQSKFPKGWDEARVKSVLEHYEIQSEDEAAYEDNNLTFIEVPNELAPTLRELIAKRLLNT